MTALPACASVPAEGLVEITCPLATVALDCFSVVGLKPASLSLAVACAAVSPVTSGRGELPGPVETAMVTRAPLPTTLPAGGVSLMTTPSATVELAVSAGTGIRPA